MADASDLKQHFTDAPGLNAAMADLLGDVTDLRVLEPSVGQGALLTGLRGVPAHIDAVDIDPRTLAQARARLAHLPLRAHPGDFLALDLPRDYDAVIANPPFGLYFTPQARKMLKQRFPGLYVRESYGLFFVQAVRRLRPGGRYVFLLPDSFLTSRHHAPLRRFIADEAAVTEIVRFPSRRFASVNFGYGHMCLIAGRRAALTAEGCIGWRDAFGDAPLLEQPRVRLTGADLIGALDDGWRPARDVLPDGWTRLGAVAECRTGIYTGDNPRFLGYDPRRVTKRLNGHPIDWERDVGAGYVPLVRGGHRAFDAAPDWAIRWDEAALAHYRNDRKARFQNSGWYFRAGLAVPMVTSRRLSASLMQDAVFDQGVVGVFPRDPAQRAALLLYLNSSAATRLRNERLGGSANNSANYLKRLPVPAFDAAAAARAQGVVARAIRDGDLPQAVCDAFVGDASGGAA